MWKIEFRFLLHWLNRLTFEAYWYSGCPWLTRYPQSHHHCILYRAFRMHLFVVLELPQSIIKKACCNWESTFFCNNLNTSENSTTYTFLFLRYFPVDDMVFVSLCINKGTEDIDTSVCFKNKRISTNICLLSVKI